MNVILLFKSSAFYLSAYDHERWSFLFLNLPLRQNIFIQTVIRFKFTCLLDFFVVIYFFFFGLCIYLGRITPTQFKWHSMIFSETKEENYVLTLNGKRAEECGKCSAFLISVLFECLLIRLVWSGGNNEKLRHLLSNEIILSR